MQAANNTINAVATQDGFIHAEPLNVQKRIGSTVYEIEVYVKKDTAETIEQANAAPKLALISTVILWLSML